MASKIFTLNYSFKNNLEKVYDCVLDLKKFGEHHPYFTEVSILKQSETHTEYHIKEKILVFGFIPQKPEYDAKVFEVEKNKHIRYTSSVMGKISLIINFYFTEPNAKGEILLRENIHLEGNNLLCSILLSTMKKAHLELFKKVG